MPDDSLPRFRRVVAVALAELERRRNEVNDLNVFPVADGDTGDNMAMTMRAVLDELDRMNGQPIDDIGRDELVAAVARAALLGAGDLLRPWQNGVEVSSLGGEARWQVLQPTTVAVLDEDFAVAAARRDGRARAGGRAA